MKMKVAMLQDLEVPREDLERTFRGRGLEPLWPPFHGPTDATAIATDGRGRVTDEELSLHPLCKVLAVAFVGCNHIDREACKKRNITILNCPDYSSTTVAELTIGLTLAVYREIPMAQGTLCAGGWERVPGMEIRGKIIGIVGLGNIGFSIARLFRAFGPKQLLGWSRRRKPDFGELGFQTSLEDIFDQADIICLSVLLNDETRGMITKELLERLKPSAVFINIARSQLCDEDALVDLLCQQRFRAALDVYSKEPLPLDDPLRKVPSEQVLLVPHIGYKSFEALQRRLELEADNLRYFSDGLPANVVQAGA
eukprot:TRINITY_DN93651_c0_g1_i1.p1 TRINITY_DN93651_c0_g1~~TRINITY_DN93651_c0_g1_i1.p1  ORF type:complete len:311 (-),score=63.50 TRINITY_DN93651_c0_g1_i1:210-1142(-)